MAEKSYDDARRDVIETINNDALDTFAHEGYDVEAIIAELQQLTGDYDFDEIPTDRFMQIVAKHDHSALGNPLADERTQAEKSDPDFQP